jgi:hypothetical protein
MANQTDNRNYANSSTGACATETPKKFDRPMKAATEIFAGGLAGWLASDTTNRPIAPMAVDGTTNILGVSVDHVDNRLGAVGDLRARVMAMTARFDNGTSTQELTEADLFKPVFAIDDHTIGRLSVGATLPCVGMLVDFDDDGSPIAFIDPAMASILSVFAKGSTFTQTYATAALVNPAVTTHAITDSSTGAVSTTAIAAITQSGNAGSADITPTKNAIATLAAEAELLKADLLATKKLQNGIIDALQAAGIAL